MKNILFTCSGGGHFYELQQLISNEKLINCFFITEKSNSKLLSDINTFLVPYDSGGSRAISIFYVIYGVLLTFFIMLRYRPILHISLGSHVSVGPTFSCWLLGISTIHIESFTRVHELSISGKFIYKFAKAFFVQWPQLTDKYKKAHYVGALF